MLRLKFRHVRAALLGAVLVAPRPAHADAPQALAPAAESHADIPSSTRNQTSPGVRPTALPWHDTFLYWDHSITTNTLGVGQSYQTRDPLYEMTIGLRPRYYFIDNDRVTLSARGDLGVISERTNSDTTTEQGEWSATDFELYGAYTYKLRESADDLTELGLRLPRITLPTSRVSYDSGKILGLGLRAGLREDVALEGRGAKFFPNLELAVKAEYGYLFTRSEVPTSSGLERVRLDPDGRSVISDQLGGASFAAHSAVFGLAALLHVHEAVLWTTAFEARPAWKYPVRHDVQVCGVVLTGCTTPSGVADPQTRSVLTLFQSEFWITFTDVLSANVGYLNLSGQIAPDGRARSVFYSPDARFYLTLNIGLDQLYEGLSPGARASAAALQQSRIH